MSAVKFLSVVMGAQERAARVEARTVVRGLLLRRRLQPSLLARFKEILFAEFFRKRLLKNRT